MLSSEGIMQRACLQYQQPGFDHPVQIYKAPFIIYMYKDRRITVDFSNAVPLNLNHASRNLDISILEYTIINVIVSS